MVLQLNLVMCFPTPDSVPVRHRDHEGRLSGRRANQTQRHADDVHQRKTRQEKHHDLNGRHSFQTVRHNAQKPYVMWLSCVQCIYFNSSFFTAHNVHVSVEGANLILESLGFSHDGTND